MSEQNKFENTASSSEHSGGHHRRPEKHGRFHGQRHGKHKSDQTPKEELLLQEELQESDLFL